MDIKKLGLADLARSGLTEADARKMKIAFWDAAKTSQVLPGCACPALGIPYFTTKGELRKGIFRARFLGPSLPVSWDGKTLRYKQSKGTPPAAYFSPLWSVWETVRTKPVNLVITEGEKKASAVCKVGVPCVGLGGTSSFQQKKKGISFLPELSAFTWEGRTVYLAFDSDVATNLHVLRDMQSLAYELARRGATPKIVKFPPLPDGGKCGADDFLVARGKDAFLELLEKSATDEQVQAVWDYNAKVAFVHAPHGILVEDSKSLQIRTRAECREKFIHDTSMVVRGGKLVKVLRFDIWFENAARIEYQGLTYRPGSPEVVDGCRNRWKGLAVEPVKGSIGPWQDLLDFLFASAEPGHRLWFERWCGYPIKHLGTKCESAVGVLSRNTGLGKTLVGETLMKIYGEENSILIHDNNLDSDFNGWALEKQFVLVDELPSFHARARANQLKPLITQHSVLINQKYLEPFTLPDFCNYYLTTNQPDAFVVDENDRRFFVHETPADPMPRKFYDAYGAWLDNGGPSALLHYFLNTLDYGDFHPREKPPMTEAKANAVAFTQPEFEDWLKHQFLPNRDGTELFSTADLCTRFNTSAVRRITHAQAGLFLRKMGFRVVRQVQIGGVRDHYRALANHAHWEKAASSLWAEHLEKRRAL